MKTDDLIRIIKQNMDTKTDYPFVIAIDGMSAAGKTTLGELLHKEFPESNLFHMDDFFYSHIKEHLSVFLRWVEM